ncbi:MAG: lysine--tRNA ligase [Alphaproteobacteria bacterium]|nr:lysine--tRNA ligase [Alphaproteobacteria bacterium]
MSSERELALVAKAWPFEEARHVVKRVGDAAPEKGYVLFETGYGPSGLPHIGTFGEVARTTMVRHAFETMTGLPTRLYAFSDDMDGLRKVPGNIPNQDMVAEHLGKPLTEIPDPFGTHESFGHHNNARLRSFLDSFGFDYTFVSSTGCYRDGRFDAALLQVLRLYDAVMAVMLPSLGAERQATYSPFLPLCPRTGRVLQVPIVAHDADAGTVTYEDEDGARVEVPVTGGACKLQWKVDWAMRWYALGVDYEMSGKDLIDSVRLSSKICRILGGTPPDGFNYELFLDENAEKISKSKGNGLSVEEWLAYAPPESLALFMYQQPRRAKRLYFDVIPKAVDEYYTFVRKYADEAPPARLENPAWHIHSGAPPDEVPPIPFALLLNLVSACHSEDKAVIWGFLSRHEKVHSAAESPQLDALVEYAIRYYRDFVKPTIRHRPPSEVERGALEDLLAVLAALPDDADGEAIQTEIYEVGKRHDFENLRDWFRALYEVLLGRSQGPRMGSFVALYGLVETRELVARVLAGDDLDAA